MGIGHLAIYTVSCALLFFIVGVLVGDEVGYNRGHLEQPEFMRIAKDFAANFTYSESNTWVNASAGLVEAERNAGYEAHVVSGWRSAGEYCKVNDSAMKAIAFATINNTDCGGAHQWAEVCVPFEPQTGDIIGNKEK